MNITLKTTRYFYGRDAFGTTDGFLGSMDGDRVSLSVPENGFTYDEFRQICELFKKATEEKE